MAKTRPPVGFGFCGRGVNTRGLRNLLNSGTRPSLLDHGVCMSRGVSVVFPYKMTKLVQRNRISVKYNIKTVKLINK
jgi:hypothetical protein